MSDVIVQLQMPINGRDVTSRAAEALAEMSAIVGLKIFTFQLKRVADQFPPITNGGARRSCSRTWSVLSVAVFTLCEAVERLVRLV